MGLFVFLTWACKSLETVRKGFIRFPNTPLLEVRPGNLSLRKVVGGLFECQVLAAPLAARWRDVLSQSWEPVPYEELPCHCNEGQRRTS